MRGKRERSAAVATCDALCPPDALRRAAIEASLAVSSMRTKPPTKPPRLRLFVMIPAAAVAREVAATSLAADSAGYTLLAPPADSGKGETPHCVIVINTGPPPIAADRAATAFASMATAGGACATAIACCLAPLIGPHGSSAVFVSSVCEVADAALLNNMAAAAGAAPQ